MGQVRDALNVRFWGTRGSLPIPGSDTLDFGGNTPCVTLTTDRGGLIIVDCGSGMRELGRFLLARNEPLHGSVFVSHVHWDHIQGFPFFGPAFVPGNSFRLFASQELEERLEAVLAGQMEFDYFPITLEAMQAEIRFEELREGTRQVDAVQVRALSLNHTRQCLGYRFEMEGRSVVYATDVEPCEGPPENGRFRLDHPRDRQLVDFSRGADLLIQDGQYTMEEYRRSVGCGHSPVEFAVQVAVAAEVRRLALFHHDPTHTDDMVRGMVEHARSLAAELGSSVEVFGAAEGLEVAL